MAWMMLVGVVVVLKFATLIEASFQTFDIDPNLQKNIITENGNTATENVYSPLNLLEEVRLEKLDEHLTDILLHPDKGVPIIYMENFPTAAEGNQFYNQHPVLQKEDTDDINEIPYKRSRYYRKYPWKRQNFRDTYDAENRYLCQPSRQDVFRLLMALHDARQGNNRNVNFCNRKRLATSVFTNIRFLGRRK